MTNPNRLAVAGAVLSLLALGGCAAGHVDPTDRDTTGAYDGVWVGEVGGPRAKRASMGGNWYMSCDWEPYEIYLVVDDGRIQIGRLENKTPVSTDGDFRIDLDHGSAGERSTSQIGSAQYVTVFSGNLSGENPRGRYVQFIESVGASGCTAPIRLRRDESAA